ncbi:MAG: hypothetical protein LCH92_08180 [Proteobacteria bacterium]|nr:hypothetical protein [Pseudomonadota bacterium]
MTKPLTRDEQLELLRIEDEIDRRRARESFLAFYMRMTGFLPPRHIRKVAALCQAMEEDKIDRAMLFEPPRHAKTLTVSKLFPAWILGRHPKAYEMIVTHTGEYSEEIGGAIRNYLRMPEWPFDSVELAPDSQAKGRWKTTAGGELNGFGSMAGNTHGRPADWLFMDDIVKGREMAMSPEQRNKVWNNYITDMRTRLQGRRKQLMTFTRWHMDDPAGRILPENWDGESGWIRDRETGEPWYVLCLPAMANREDDPLGRKIGEWLWPEEFGEEQLGPERIRGGFNWSALYQQRPTPETGLMFSAAHVEQTWGPSLDLTRLAFYGSSDYAVTAEAGARDPDFTVHMVWAVDDDWNFYLMDIWRGRFTAERWASELVRLMRKWKPTRWFEESGQIIKSVGPFLNQTLQRERLYIDRVQITSSPKKEAKAQVLLGMAAMGKMFLPRRETLNADQVAALDAFVTELLQFPGGKHDDTVDTASLFARGIDRIIQGTAPPPKTPHEQTLDDLWSAHELQMSRRRD